MSRAFLTAINVAQLASDPENPSEGDLYYNTTIGALKVYTGAQWVIVGSGAGGGDTIHPFITGII